MIPFRIFLDGLPASAAYDSSASECFVAQSFRLSAFPNLSRRVCSQLVSVDTSHGVFTCEIRLSSVLDLPFDVVLGRDWFDFGSYWKSSAFILGCEDDCLSFSGRPSSDPVLVPRLRPSKCILPCSVFVLSQSFQMWPNSLLPQ